MTEFLRRHAVLIAIVAVLAVPIILGLGDDPTKQSLRDSLQAPSSTHWFGTDHLGRDVMVRVAHAFLLDIGLSAAIVALSLVIGVAVGLVAGEFGGFLDGFLTFVMDVTATLPHLVLALVLAAYLGGGAMVLILALGLAGWVKYARIVRTETARLKDVDFLTVSRVLGASRLKIVLQDVLPNVLPPLAGLISLQFGHAILGISSLGFLGVGVQPPTPEWGSMIAEARPYIARAPWLAIFPGLFLFAFTAMCVVISGKLIRKPEAQRTVIV